VRIDIEIVLSWFIRNVLIRKQEVKSNGPMDVAAYVISPRWEKSDEQSGTNKGNYNYFLSLVHFGILTSGKDGRWLASWPLF
jgi:hypothetical protein